MKKGYTPQICVYISPEFCIINILSEVTINDIPFWFKKKISNLISWTAVGRPSIGMVVMVMYIGSEHLQMYPVIFYPEH